MILSENPTPDEVQAALALIRTKVRAGLMTHPDWPPPAHMPLANRLLLLDRIANELLHQIRTPHI